MQLVLAFGNDVQLHGGVLAFLALAFGQGGKVDFGVLAENLDDRVLETDNGVTDDLDRVIVAREFDLVRLDVWFAHGGNGLVSRGNNNTPAVCAGACRSRIS